MACRSMFFEISNGGALNTKTVLQSGNNRRSAHRAPASLVQNKALSSLAGHVRLLIEQAPSFVLIPLASERRADVSPRIGDHSVVRDSQPRRQSDVWNSTSHIDLKSVQTSGDIARDQFYAIALVTLIIRALARDEKKYIR